MLEDVGGSWAGNSSSVPTKHEQVIRDNCDIPHTIGPHNVDVEQGLLGAILLRNSAIANVEGFLREEHFFDPLHAQIYAAVVATSKAGMPANPVTLKRQFLHHPNICQMSVPQYLGTLAANAAMTINVIAYAKLIVELAQRRNLLAMLQAAALAVTNTDDVMAAVMARLAGSLQAVASCSPTALRSYALPDLMNLDLPPRDWALENLLRVGDLMMVYAARGIGKTWLVLELGISLSLGRRFLKWHPPRAFRVYHVCGEMHISSLRDRIKSLLPPNSAAEAMHRFRVLSATQQERGIPDLSTPEGQAEVERDMGDAEVVILDNVSTLFCTKENEADSWQAIQDWLIRLRAQGRTVILVHHAGKNGGQRGTSRREDILDLVWSLEAEPDSDKSEGAQFTIKFKKNRALTGEEVRDFAVRLKNDHGSLSWDFDVPPQTNHKLVEVLKLHKDGSSVREIEEATGVPHSTVHRWLKTHGPSSKVSHDPSSLDNGTAGQAQTTV